MHLEVKINIISTSKLKMKNLVSLVISTSLIYSVLFIGLVS